MAKTWPSRGRDGHERFTARLWELSELTHLVVRIGDISEGLKKVITCRILDRGSQKTLIEELDVLREAFFQVNSSLPDGAASRFRKPSCGVSILEPFSENMSRTHSGSVTVCQTVVFWKSSESHLEANRKTLEAPHLVARRFSN